MTAPEMATPHHKGLIQEFNDIFCSHAEIGKDSSTGGYRRYAWTLEDQQNRLWFAEQANLRGLELKIDRNGNQWAWWGNPDSAAIATGSHLDSVPNGGAFDGPLGVVSAFMAVDEMRRRGVQPSRSLAVVNFADEEGARFGVACMGSRLSAGVLEPADALNLLDADGVTVKEAMETAGVDSSAVGADANLTSNIKAFVELHIEQGRALVDLDSSIGVATAVWPHGRWHLRFEGKSDHAGTTRLKDRRDPTIPFATSVLAARAAAVSHGGVATVGRVIAAPNGVNVIADSVSAWLDCRAESEETVSAIVEQVLEAARAAAATEKVTVTVHRESYTPNAPFSTELTGLIQEVLGTSVPELPTGAGHDAAVLSKIVPSAMLFVRNLTGNSHSPNEHANQVDCVDGVLALAEVLEKLVTIPEEELTGRLKPASRVPA